MSSTLRSGSDATALLDELGVRAGDLPPRRPRLPDPQEPDPLESLAGDVVEEAILEIVERGGAPEGDPALLQHDARVDLIDRRIVHGGTSLSVPESAQAGLTSLRATKNRRYVRCLGVRSGRLESRTLLEAGEDALVRENHLRRESSEQSHQGGDDRGPAGLMAGAEAGAVVSVEVLAEQDEVLPVRVLLELLRPAVDRAVPLVIAEEQAGEPVGQLLSHLVEVHVLARSGRTLDLEVVAVEAVHLQAARESGAR